MNIIRISEAAPREGVHRSTVYRNIKDNPNYPKPVRLGPNSVGLVEEEHDAYIETLIAERDAELAAG